MDFSLLLLSRFNFKLFRILISHPIMEHVYVYILEYIAKLSRCLNLTISLLISLFKELWYHFRVYLLESNLYHFRIINDIIFGLFYR